MLSIACAWVSDRARIEVCVCEKHDSDIPLMKPEYKYEKTPHGENNSF